MYGIFDYLRVGVYAVYNSTFSTGVAMVLKHINSNRGTAAHRDTCDTLWASGDAQTHTFTLFLFLLSPFLATMSFAVYFLVRFSCLFPCFLFSENVPGLIWFGSVYLVTTAGFVAGQLNVR